MTQSSRSRPTAPVGLRLASIAALAMLSWATTAGSQPANPLPTKLGPESHLWVEGDSTLHKYRLDAKKPEVAVGPGDASGDSEGGLPALLSAGRLKTLTVRVLLSDLSSGDKGLDDNMRKAMRADLHPDIGFRMESLESSPSADSAGSSVAIKGRLDIAGVEKPVEIRAKVEKVGAALHVTGEKALLMSDYGIKPPTFMLGAMKVRDPITVHFDLQLEPNS